MAYSFFEQFEFMLQVSLLCFGIWSDRYSSCQIVFSSVKHPGCSVTGRAHSSVLYLRVFEVFKLDRLFWRSFAGFPVDAGLLSNNQMMRSR